MQFQSIIILVLPIFFFFFALYFTLYKFYGNFISFGYYIQQYFFKIPLYVKKKKKKKKNVENNFSQQTSCLSYKQFFDRCNRQSMIILVYQYFQIFFALYCIYLYNIYHNPISFEYSAKYSYSILHPSPLICIDT